MIKRDKQIFDLLLKERQRQINGIDYDDDKIEVANNCAIKNDRIEFSSGDITKIEFVSSDIFILNDVLHYFPTHLQVKTIEKCITKVNSGGMIIIRDSDKDLQKRQH